MQKWPSSSGGSQGIRQAIATGLAEARADLLNAARQLTHEHESMSTSLLQRRLRIGYPRATRIMEKLEEEGFEREPAE